MEFHFIRNSIQPIILPHLPGCHGLRRSMWLKLIPCKSCLKLFSDWNQKGRNLLSLLKEELLGWEEIEVARSHLPHGMENAICREYQTNWLEIERESWKCSCHRIQTSPEPVPYILCLGYTSLLEGQVRIQSLANQSGPTCAKDILYLQSVQ